MFLKNTAGQFIHFQGVDAATGGIKSAVTWTVRRCIDGTFAAATGTVTEDGTTGWYKFAMSQADTNGNNIGFNFTGTGAVPQTVNIVTTSLNPYDAVRFGMTALPNAAAGANTGLPVVGTQVPNATAGAANGLLISGSNAGTTTFGALTITGALTASGGVSTTTIATSGTVTLNALTVTNATNLSGAVSLGSTLSVTGNVTLSGLAGLAVTNGITANITGNLVGTVSTLTTYTGNTPQTGDSFARIGAAGAGLTALGDARIVNLDAAVSSRLSAAGYTAPDNTRPANFTALAITAGGAITVGTNNDKTGYTITAAEHANIADKLLGRTIAGAADGGRMVKDALRALRNKVAIAAGVLTVYAEDDVTPAYTAAVTTAAGNPIDSIDPV